jgi:hypothetical protein
MIKPVRELSGIVPLLYVLVNVLFVHAICNQPFLLSFFESINR